jgi:hypothetical protein
VRPRPPGDAWPPCGAPMSVVVPSPIPLSFGRTAVPLQLGLDRVELRA